jgi:Rrf2 family protein
MVLLAKKYNGPNGTPRVLSVREMANLEAIPYGFLEKIIIQMEKAGLLRAKIGALGGYALALAPAKISVKNIVDVLDKNKKAVDCSLCGRSKKCLTKNVWEKVENSLNKTLDSITLADLIR